MNAKITAVAVICSMVAKKMTLKRIFSMMVSRILPYGAWFM